MLEDIKKGSLIEHTCGNFYKKGHNGLDKRLGRGETNALNALLDNEMIKKQGKFLVTV